MSLPTTSPSALTAALQRWLDLPMAHLPSVTADGEEVLFVSDQSGLPLVWVVPSRGGPPTQLGPASERVGAIDASPAGPRAVAAVDSGGNEHWQLHLLDRTHPGPPATRVLTHDLTVIHQPGRWRPDGERYVFASNARDRRYFDILELDTTDGAAPRPILSGDATHDVIAADEHRVLIGRANTNLDIDLLLVDGDRTVHLNPHDGEVTVQSAALTPDGIYAAANPGRELAALLRYRAGATHHEFVREFAGELELIRASPTGKELLLSVNRQGWSEVHLFNPDTGEDRQFNSGPRGVLESASWYPDGTAFAYGVSSVDGLHVYRRDIQTGKERRLAGPSAVPEVVGPPMLRQFTTVDRVTVPYWEYSPRTPAKGTLVWIHGGPEAQARPGFAPTLEFLVSRGWRVIAPNVRGSTGYGRTFTHLDDVRKRMDSVRDLRDLVTDLVRQGKATPGRIGILGGSYGGFMVLAALCTYPDLWGAAVDLLGIANFVTFLERTGPWRRRLREAEYGSLETDRDFLESISPLSHAAEIRTPLLVIHGRNDPRVPLHEAEQIVQTLRDRSRPVELLVFDDEGHGIVRRPNRLAAWSRAAEWFESQLSSGAA